MRVALVLSAFPKLSETFIVRKFLGLLDHGVDVHVVCGLSDPREWDNFPELGQHPGIRERVHRAMQVRPRWKAVLSGSQAAAAAVVHNPRATRRYVGFSGKKLLIDSSLVSLAPDLVHFEFGALAVGRMHVGSMLDCKVVVSFRGYDLNFSGVEEAGYYEEVWAGADALHFLSHDLWNRAQERGCPPEKCFRLIPPSVDTDFWSTASDRSSRVLGVGERPLRVLGVGRLEWKKGYEHALGAIRRLRNRGIDCRYEILGSGTAYESLAFAVHQLGLHDVVRLSGAALPEVVRQRMTDADVFLHAAVTEGFCNAVVEAQSMGLPVVVTDAGGLPENVMDGVSGFVVPRRDPSGMSEKLALLAGDPDLRKRMGDCARQRAVQNFNLSKQVDLFVNLYSDLLEGTAK